MATNIMQRAKTWLSRLRFLLVAEERVTSTTASRVVYGSSTRGSHIIHAQGYGQLANNHAVPVRLASSPTR
jgi:hypothetical protein